MQTQAHGLSIFFQALLGQQKEVNKWGNSTGGPGSRRAHNPSLDRAITQINVCGKCLGKSRAGLKKISASHISREPEVNWNNLSESVYTPSGMQKLLNLWELEHLQEPGEIWNLTKHKHRRPFWTWVWSLPPENTLGEVQGTLWFPLPARTEWKKLAGVLESCQASPHLNLIKSQMDVRTGFLYVLPQLVPFPVSLSACGWV